jgi:hypothetical protein
MTKHEQIKFVKDILKLVEKKIKEKAKQFPKNWEGPELSQYISDCAQSFKRFKELQGQRRKNYNNDIYINNL